jgi:hypothetical protein
MNYLTSCKAGMLPDAEIRPTSLSGCRFELL